VLKTGGTPQKVYLTRTCPEHGASSTCISSDARFYWLAKGGGEESCCGGSACCADESGIDGSLGANAGRGNIEQLSTCLALIEIVNSCNLSCPTCYADSPLGSKGEAVDAVPLENLKSRIDSVVARKGAIDILQLSGGEPTLHPQFFELLEWAQSHKGIGYVLINTNGVRIAKDAEFAARLREAFVPGKLQLYLQFDGIQEGGQRWLRGADLREVREEAIRQCGRVPITLAMTVTPENLPHLWEAIEFGLRHENIRGICFQPMFGSGRVPVNSGNAERLNTADIILGAVAQSEGKLRFEDFTPLPCGDPNCATIGYLLKIGGAIRSISDFVNFQEMQGFLKDKVLYRLEDLSQCGCESEPLGELLKHFELDERNTFRLLVKPFMDSETWDEDRIDRCCTHVIRPDGKLDSFCRYYSAASA
jgi:uncharacterized radical SAM superfamily Fe-S cluster-containing enzyme